MIYGGSKRSAAQKALAVIIESIVLAVAIWMLQFGGLEAISRLLHLQWADAVRERRTLLTLAFCIVYLRILVTIFYLLKRAIG